MSIFDEMKAMQGGGMERKLEDYIDMALRQRWAILIVCLCVFVIGMLYSLSKAPIYLADMTIQIQSAENAMASQQMVRGQVVQTYSPFFQLPQGSSLQTNIAVIQSLPVAERIVKDMKLNRVTTLIEGRTLWMRIRDRLKRVVGINVPLTHVSFNEFSPPTDKPYATVLVKFLSKGRFQVKDPLTGKKLETTAHHSVELDGFKLSISGYYGPEGTIYQIGNKPAEPIGKGIRSRLQAKRAGIDMLHVSYTDHDRFRAAAVLKSLAAVYGDEDVAFKSGQLQKKVSVLNQIQKKIQNDLNDLHASTNSATLKQDLQGSMLLQQTQGLGAAWATTYQSIKQTQVMLDFISRVSDADLPAAIQVLDVPTTIQTAFSDLSGKISTLQDKRALLLKGVTDKFPGVVDLNHEIAVVKRQVKKLREQAISALQQKIRYLTQQMDSAVDMVVKQQRTAADASMLRRALERKSQEDALNSLLAMLLNVKQQSMIDQAILVSDVRVIEPAEVPSKPILPNRMKDAILALLAGLAVGLGVGFLRENLDRSVKSLSELEAKTGLSVFGTLPMAESEGGNPFDLITVSRPRSSESESYRSLRTNIQFANLEKTIQTLILTSAVPGEGKTTTTCNLAVTMANSGLKTLLIDCDLRKPRVNDYFGLERHTGLSDILIHSKDWRDLAMDTGVENLSVITSGSIPPNPSELLGSNSMSEFLEQAKGEYQMILLDVPPVLVVTDAVLLGPKVDGLFLVVRSDHAPIDAVQRAITQLNTVHIKPVGVIFNGFKVSSAGYGYKRYGRYGHYGRYGGKYGYYSHDYGSEEENQSGKGEA